MNDDKVFIDSNVLVYLHTDDDLVKRDKAFYAMADCFCLTGVNNVNETITVLS